MAASGTGSLMFINNIAAYISNKMNSDMCRAKLSAQIQPNAAQLTVHKIHLQCAIQTVTAIQ